MDDYLAKPIRPGTAAWHARWLCAEPSTGDGCGETAAKVLDDSHLEALGSHLPADDLCQLIALFGEQLGAQTSSIEALLATGDLETLSREAHSLAGAASNYGALKLSRFAREIEAACDSADVEGVARRVERLAAISEETSTALRDWLTAGDCGRVNLYCDTLRQRGLDRNEARTHMPSPRLPRWCRVNQTRPVPEPAADPLHSRCCDAPTLIRFFSFFLARDAVAGLSTVMPGLVPGIHVFFVDAHGSSPWAEGPRVKPGHDRWGS